MKLLLLNKDSKNSFKLLAGINRPIAPNHVTKIANSLRLIGCIRPVIIAILPFLDGRSTKYIIDGQHLFFGLLRNNMDIPYVIINIADKRELIEKIALLNASSKSWAMIDYVTSWGSINKDYTKLKQYFDTYDMEISIVAGILANRSSSGGAISTIIKTGEFKIVNEDEAKKHLDYLTDVLSVVPRMNRYENKYVCSEFISFVRKIEEYNHSKFISNLRKQKNKFVLATQKLEALEEMFLKLSK